MIDYMELERIKTKYYDPGNPTSVLLWRLFKDPRVRETAAKGKVVDNKDPDGLGRVKVIAPLVFGETTSPWIQVVQPFASKEFGTWFIPDIDDAVILLFLLNSPARPFVLGCTYTTRTHPFYKENKDNNRKYIRTKSGLEIVMDDKDGEEQLVVSAKDGKMRIILDTKGIQIVNDCGDINIKAKKVTMESKHFNVTTKKAMNLKADGNLSFKGEKSLTFKASSDLVAKGKKIKLKGSAGTCAGGKQIAKKDDPVVGVDLHDVQIPTNSGMRTIPSIPHPYVGKLADKLSDDVTVNDKPAAVKGSKSKYSTPGHIPIGGVKFKKNPNNEGEVSSGTEPSVKINGKEAAVLGAMVKTCADPQPAENCSIIAVGAAVPIPFMPEGFDPEQYKRDGGFKINTREPVADPKTPNTLKDERSLSSPKWSTDSCLVGDEVTMSVSVKSQQGMRSAVHFEIYPEGADPETDAPIAKRAAHVDGSKAEAEWRYVRVRPNIPLKVDPILQQQADTIMGKPVPPKFLRHYIKDLNSDSGDSSVKTDSFFFTAWAFKCEKVKSENVKLGESLNVTVRDALGQPIKDAELTIKDPMENETTESSDSKGTISKSELPGGIHRIGIKKRK